MRSRRGPRSAWGGSALLLGFAAWAVRLDWLVAPSWVLVAWGIALVALAAAVWLGWRAHRGLSPAGVAGRLEEIGAWRRGTLTALLDTSAAGTSEALFGVADRAQAAELERRGTDATAHDRPIPATGPPGRRGGPLAGRDGVRDRGPGPGDGGGALASEASLEGDGRAGEHRGG